MPTRRLSDWDKSNLVDEFERILDRWKNAQPFPIEEANLRNWLLSLLPRDVESAYRLLMRTDKSMVQDCISYTSLTLDTLEGQYWINVNIWNSDEKFPNTLYQLDTDDYAFVEVLEWARLYHATGHNARAAYDYVQELVWSCTSAGQVDLLLPEEVKQYIPSSMVSSLKGAERKSRVPRSFERDEEAERIFINALAVGSLSPKDRDKKFAKADVSDFQSNGEEGC
jgi:hypothetical protein